MVFSFVGCDFLPWEELVVLESRSLEWFVKGLRRMGCTPCFELWGAEKSWHNCKRPRELAIENRDSSHNSVGHELWYLPAADNAYPWHLGNGNMRLRHLGNTMRHLGQKNLTMSFWTLKKEKSATILAERESFKTWKQKWKTVEPLISSRALGRLSILREFVPGPSLPVQIPKSVYAQGLQSALQIPDSATSAPSTVGSPNRGP